MKNLDKFVGRHIFADRVQMLRKEKGLTQKELANELNTSVSSIISYENAQRFPSSAVLAMISQYFHVSQDYLIGKSGERGLTKWEDDDIVDAVRESLPQQLTGLNVLLKERSAQEQKEIFDILVELGHILNMKDASQRAVAMELIQAVFAATTRCIDVCTGAGDDIDPVTRPQQAIDAAMESYARALQKAFFACK